MGPGARGRAPASGAGRHLDAGDLVGHRAADLVDRHVQPLHRLRLLHPTDIGPLQRLRHDPVQLDLRPRVVCDLDRVLLVDVERDARIVRLQSFFLARVEHRLGRVEHLRLAVAQVGVLDRHPAVFGHTDLRARVRLHVHGVGAGGGLEAPARLHDLRPEIIVPRRHGVLKHVTLEARPAAPAGEQPRDSTVAGVALQRQQPGHPAVHRHAFDMLPPAGEQPRDSTVAGVALQRPARRRPGRPQYAPAGRRHLDSRP